LRREELAQVAAWAEQTIRPTAAETAGPWRLATCIVELEGDLGLEPGAELDRLVKSAQNARYQLECRADQVSLLLTQRPTATLWGAFQ
jgi:hypothetical protein